MAAAEPGSLNAGTPWSVSRATADDVARLAKMLRAANLPHDDVRPGPYDRYLVARDSAGMLVGGVGLSLRRPHALLRSLIVAPDARGAGLGSVLVNAAEASARDEGVETLYLLTLDAAPFFHRFGYADTEREAVPATIRKTGEFSGLCPASAACLSKHLDKQGTDRMVGSP